MEPNLTLFPAALRTQLYKKKLLAEIAKDGAKKHF